MSVAVSIFHPELKQLVGDADELRLEGATVGECLADLARRFPGAERLLFKSPGVLHRLVHVFVNHESLRKAPMSQPVKDTDRLIIAILASGG